LHFDDFGGYSTGMKKVIVSMLIAAVLAMSGFAQDERRDGQCPAAFRTFYGKFKSAVIRNDKTSVAAMTKFPFIWGFDAGDEGTYSRSQFVRNFGRLFDADVRRFLRRKDLACVRSSSGAIDITTENALHLGFVRSGRTYMFASYMVEP
jgi:hypothetical protein